MEGPKAPRDPEKMRPYFYILKDKEIFAKASFDRRWRNEAEAVEEHVSGNASGGVCRLRHREKCRITADESA